MDEFDSHVQEYKKHIGTISPSTGTNWFGSVDLKTGVAQKGMFEPIANTALGAVGAFMNWQSLSEAKRNNEQTRQNNIVNSRNAKKAYDFDIDRIMGSRMKASGKSDDEIRQVQSSDDYKNKYHARSL